LDKKQAAEYLGISTRTLERWVKDGKIRVRYELKNNAETAIYDVEELDLIKEDKQIVRVKPSTSDITSDTTPNSSDIIQIAPGGFLSPFRDLIERLVAAIENLRGQDAKTTPATLRGKLLLTLPDAQILTGLSREILMTAIKNDELPAKIMGKSYRIKTQDLIQYIANLDF
jgi:predicted DNA-binding transcriptional regulator AlpA